MSLDIDPIYVFYGFVVISAILFVEGIYLLFFSGSSYRSRINRRLQLMHNQADREGILIQLRRERGLTSGGDFRLPLVWFNKLLLQSGVTTGVSKLAIFVLVGGLVAFSAVMMIDGRLHVAAATAVFSVTLAPIMVLKFLRGRRRKRFGGQFPDALDIIVRSLRAGHPVPIAITMVGRELPDPVGSEFGVVADEITYGADLETAMRNLYHRVGQEDLPLFVTAVSIQGSTGGNLSEILENLSAVIRLRFKMRRKIRALASEGRASAMILSSLPVAMFGIIQVVAPDFYTSVWNESITQVALGGAICWMGVGVFIMYRMVNFRI